MRLQGKGVYYGAMERLMGINGRPKYALRQLYECGLIVNMSPHAIRGKITLTDKGVTLMREVCSTR